MKWKESLYGFEHLDLGLFKITVGWEKGCYFYRYLNVRSETVFTEMGECKLAAEESVARQLRAVLDLLD